MNDIIHDTYMFIILLKTDRPVINILEDIRWKEIKEAAFFILTLFVGRLSMRGPSKSLGHFR